MIEKVKFDGFKYIDGGVCAAQGFKANGIQCGLAHEGATVGKKKNDLAVIIADRVCSAAAVYTTNKVKGAPIAVTKKKYFRRQGNGRNRKFSECKYLQCGRPGEGAENV